MKQIWKYVLRIQDSQTIYMPISAEILCVKSQKGILCLWVSCDPTANQVPRNFSIYGTGHDVFEINNEKYIGTVLQADDKLVWHIFETRGE